MRSNEKTIGNHIVGRFTNWLSVTLYRQKLKYLRNEIYWVPTIPLEGALIEELIADESNDTNDTYEREYNTAAFEFTNEKLETAYYNLPIKRQRVLVMIYVLEMGSNEIAAVFNCTTQHIYNMHSLAIKQLRAELTKPYEQ